jgi:hypothetical protein
MEILINYVLLNVALFGSICLFAKAVEHTAWYVICNYDSIVNRMKG